MPGWGWALCCLLAFYAGFALHALLAAIARPGPDVAHTPTERDEVDAILSAHRRLQERASRN